MLLSLLACLLVCLFLLIDDLPKISADMFPGIILIFLYVSN